MTPFAYLIVAHLVGDFLLQTGWMAANKAKRWDALLTHAGVYTLCILTIGWFGFGGLSLWGIALVYVSHIIIDRRTFVAWWVEKVMKAPDNQKIWLSIMADQTFHIVFLVLALHL